MLNLLPWTPSWLRHFFKIRGDDLEWNTQKREKLTTARRG
jgi:hypothetical protein